MMRMKLSPIYKNTPVLINELRRIFMFNLK